MISNKEKQASALASAWRRYQWLFTEAPHGTYKQMLALLELIPEQDRKYFGLPPVLETGEDEHT